MFAKIFSRKSTKNTCRSSFHREIKPLKPEDFDDVFGGPPRHVFPGRTSEYFYDDMFHNPVRHSVDLNGRELPKFIISTSRGCGSEVFRGGDTTSVLNSEEFSPPTSDDDVYSPFDASKLSVPKVPMMVPQTWNASSKMMHGVQQRPQDIPDFPFSRPSSVGYQFTDNDPQTGSTSKSDDEDDDDENEISSSFVFGSNYSYREGSDEGVRVDEAIAWAKESYLSHSSSAETTEMPDGGADGSESVLHIHEEYPNKRKPDKDQGEVDESREMKILEENIKLWSSGKERNIELLLSTLQDILWQNSGWCPIPHTSLYQSSNVKKAYQKARLLLHPDKLQQRGATLLQKYVAQRIFLILQEAWDAYISQDVIVSSRG
nr:PREDICTED: auxilin-related protein 2-like isoform X1 [Daucus carota subsp. sativus]